MAACLIGVDGGTESLRAGVFDLRGRPLAFAAAPYATRFPRPGWAEQDPADWWAALARAVRQAVSESGVRPAEVAAMAVDTTCCSVVALDAAGRPVRPALIWMDVRAAAEARAVLATGDPALRINGDGQGPVSAEWLLPKALWLRRHESAAYAAVVHICEYQDYLNHRLTGRLCASIANAAVRWHYLPRQGGYQPSLLGALGLDDLAGKLPREVLPLGALVGGLTAEAADHLGLPAGLPVAQGGSDAFVGMIGLGVVAAPQMAMITGSSHLQLGLSERAFHGRGIWGTYADAVIPGLHVVEGGQTSTGSVIDWLRRLFGADFVALNAEAAALPPGADGLLALDHFQGNRTPYTDAASRGAFVGLSLKHGRAHLYRAAIEAVACGTELILETMRGHGYAPADMTVAGGATRAELWLRIHADVSGLPLRLTRVADAPALGCAILAAVAAGHHESIGQAAAAMVEVVRTVEPEPAATAAYRPVYDAYKALYPALAPLHHRLAGEG